jgi:hypothetical protein
MFIYIKTDLISLKYFTMKKTLLLSIIAGLFLIVITGCEKILDKLIEQTINSDYTNIDFTGNPNVAGTYTETIEVVNFDLDSLLNAEGLDQGTVNSVKIKDASVQVVGEGNLDPFESFLITLEAPGKNAVTVAEVTSVPTGITEIALTKKGIDLSDYLKSDHYTIKVKTVLDQDLETHLNMQAKVRYEIKVGL